MSFSDSITSGFVRYIDFKTRSSRSEFLWWILFTILAALAISILVGMIFGPSVQQSNTGDIFYNYDGGTLGSIFQLVTLVPTIAVICRRLHDLDRSGWWQLAPWIPFVITFVFGIFGLSFTIPMVITFCAFALLLFWLVRRGDLMENRFGPDPLAGTA